jgi:hypothetical protein
MLGTLVTRRLLRPRGAVVALCANGAVPVPTAARLYLDHVAPTADMPPSRCVVATAANTGTP